MYTVRRVLTALVDVGYFMMKLDAHHRKDGLVAGNPEGAAKFVKNDMAVNGFRVKLYNLTLIN